MGETGGAERSHEMFAHKWALVKHEVFYMVELSEKVKCFTAQMNSSLTEI